MTSPKRPMPSEAGISQFMEICDSFYPPDAVTATIAQQREWYDALCARFDRPLPEGMQTSDEVVSGTIPVRHYKPVNIRTATHLLYLHGGGFVVGSLESHHAICAEIADHAGAELISVDYRLAPEYRWPAQTDDCFSVLKQLLAEKKSVVLIGDSAGGNLAAGRPDFDLSGTRWRSRLRLLSRNGRGTGSDDSGCRLLPHYSTSARRRSGLRSASSAVRRRSSSDFHHGGALRSAARRRPQLCGSPRAGRRRGVVSRGAADGACLAAGTAYERGRTRRLCRHMRGGKPLCWLPLTYIRSRAIRFSSNIFRKISVSPS